MAKLIALLIVAWLPGAAIFRAPFAAREKRASLDAEERLFWSVIVSVAVSLAIALAMAAVHRYSFGRLLAADVTVAAIAALASRFDLRLGSKARIARLSMLLPLSLVVLGLWRFFPSSEYIIGGKDPGIYVNAGVQIAQRGTFLFHDPVVATVPEFARDLFFPSHQRHDYYSLRFMGFRIMDPDAGTVVSQFPHLFSISVAIGYGIDGLSGARHAVGVWAVLGVLALYFVGARVVGRPAAWAAGALLSLHVVQVWFARYPNAEVVMQALLLAALLAFARSHVDDDEFFAPIAGSLLGLLLFLRFDTVLVIAAVLCALALMVLAGVTRVRLWFFAPLAAAVLLSVPYLLGPMRAYADYPIIFVNSFSWWQHLLLAGCVALGIVALILGARVQRLAAWVHTWIPWITIAAIVVAATYALYWREPARGLAFHDAYALRTFVAFYLTLPGLVAALLGYAMFARRTFWRAPELYTTIAVFSFFFFYKIRIAPEHFWMARRFLPVILPGALLFIAAISLSGVRGGWAPTRLLRATIGLAFIALLASQYARSAAPVLPHVEYQGVIARLERLSTQIGDGDLLVVEPRDASDTHILAVPLAFIYSRNTLLLSSRLPDKEAFARFLEWARTKYARVLFIGGGGTSLLSPAWGTRPIASDRFQLPEYDAPMNAYPRFVRQKEFDYSVYELTLPDPEAANMPFDLDVGVDDDLHVVRWHAKERTEGRTFRWSRDRSFVSITNLRADSRQIVLTMSAGGRPQAAPGAEVTVTLEKEALGTVRVDTGFKPYAFDIPPALAARLSTLGRALELTITTSVWRPSSVLGTADDREVGVMLDRVTIK
ncbi:MAG TPA: hypothetical protein VH740_06390 [Vicinamibacterales bacterium]